MVKVLFDYLDVPKRVVKAIKEKARQVGNGYNVLLISRYSTHPGDSHLYVVLALGGPIQSYVTWLYNASIRSLECGHYDMDFKTALLDFVSRLK